MTRTAHTIPNVPMPDGAVKAEEWQPERYRVFEGEQRYINESISVWTHGLQNADGSIDDGTSREAPGIAVSGIHWEHGIDAETARRLADFLVMAADEVGQWAQPPIQTETEFS
jgi:hypothetical protein